MDLIDLAKACSRQWPILIAGLLVTGLLAWTSAGAVEPEYEASGTVLLIGPSVVRRDFVPTEEATDPPDTGDELISDDFDPVNPYLSFSPSLYITAGAVNFTLIGDGFASTIADEGFSGSYSVELAVNTPLLTVTATDATAEDAVRLLERVLTELTSQLEQRQERADVPPYLWITNEQVDLSAPVELNGARNRVFLGVMGIGIAVSVVLAVFVDFVRRSRQRRRRARAPQDGEADSSGSIGMPAPLAMVARGEESPDEPPDRKIPATPEPVDVRR